MSNITSLIYMIYSTIINNKIIDNPFFFMLSTEKSFEMFPRHNGIATMSESFSLNL